MSIPECTEYTPASLHVNELVSFDADLFEHLPVQHSEIDCPSAGHQYLAVIVEPQSQPSHDIAKDSRFTFCGYDLIHEQTQISVIVSCGAAFEKAMNPQHLNALGLFSRYEDAKSTQKELRGIHPNEEHADCVIVEIRRYIAE